MNNDFIRLPLLFAALCALQVFVFNHVQLFGVAMPLFYVYFVIAMRKGMAKWAMLVWAFVMGITLDIFANTPGVCAASLTLAAMAQPSLLELFVTREGDSDFILAHTQELGNVVDLHGESLGIVARSWRQHEIVHTLSIQHRLI